MKKTAKKHLAESAIELLSKEPIGKITVARIANNCGLSTRTFYNNFRDKYELFIWIYKAELEKKYQANLDNMNFSTFLRCSGQILLDYKEFFFNYQRYSGQNDFRDSVFQPLYEYYTRIIQNVYHDVVTKEVDESLVFFILGMIEHVNRSYKNEGLQPLDDAVSIFIRAIPENLKKYL